MIHVARLLRERAVAQHADPGRSDLGPPSVPRRQAPQILDDLAYGLRSHVGQADVELQRVGRPRETGEPEQDADFGLRSEERRVGKECRSRLAAEHSNKEKTQTS